MATAQTRKDVIDRLRRHRDEALYLVEAGREVRWKELSDDGLMPY